MKNEIFYSQDDDSDRKKFETPYAAPDVVAEEIADYIYKLSAPDLDDPAEWPITIALYKTVDGPRFATFKVGMEYTTSFSATELETSP